MAASKINGWLKFILLAASVIFAAGGLAFAVRMNTNDIEETKQDVRVVEEKVNHVELAQQAIPFIQEDIKDIKKTMEKIESKLN